MVAETFTDTTPLGPNGETSDSPLDSKENKQIPYLITVNYIHQLYYVDYNLYLLILYVCLGIDQ